MEGELYSGLETEVFCALLRCLSGDETLQVQKTFDLQRECKRQKSGIFQKIGRYARADFFFEKGCKLLGQYAAFVGEVRYRMTYDTIQQVQYMHQALGLPVIVFISDEPCPTGFLSKVEDKCIKVISISRLTQIAGKNKSPKEQCHPDEAENTQAKLLASLKADFHDGNVTLFLGAGVSASAELPDWDELMKRFLRELSLSEFKRRDYKALVSAAGNSPIIAARFMTSAAASENIKEEDQLSEKLQHALYADGKVYTSDLLDTIVTLCEAKNGDIRLVTSVITMNFDNLVEQHLTKRNIPYKSVYKLGKPLLNELQVIHVHGILPQNQKDNYMLPALAEQDYHTLYKQSYNWSNVEIIHALQRSTCIFIGLSMLDPNLRRLLDFANTDTDLKPRHYAILPYKQLKKSRRLKDGSLKKLQEDVFTGLGINVLWYNDGEYAKVPEYLKSLLDTD